MSFTADDGVVHRVWRVSQRERVEAIREAFAAVEYLYIADGHHRCAAAAAFGLRQRREHPDFTGEEPWNFILSVCFPDDELCILDYNRVVRGLNGWTPDEFLQQVRARFCVGEAQTEPVRPQEKGRFGMYLTGSWYPLSLYEQEQEQDPVRALDVSVLQEKLLFPILGIADPRADERISFVGGVRGLEELKRRADEGAGVAFSLFPTSMEELFCVADAGRLMPPKSTWFEPKLRSGLLLHDIENNVEGGNS